MTPDYPMLQPLPNAIAQRISPVKAFILDVDGVLTDGFVVMTANGEQLKRMNIKDGYALQHAVRIGYRVAIISGGSSEGVAQRLQGLGLTDVFMRASNKLEVYERYMADTGLADHEIAYIGDDMPDYPVMRRVGFAACPADAAADIRHIAHYACALGGGQGCVREVFEMIMKHQDRWYSDEVHHW